MRILIIGADDNWQYEYISYVLKNENNSIVLLLQTNNDYAEIYKELGVEVFTYDVDGTSFIERFYQRNRIIRRFKKEQGSFDIIQVNFVSIPNLLRLINTWNMSKHHILTFWGGDLMDVPEYFLFFYKFFLNRSDKINLLTDNMYQKFMNIYGKKYSNKLTVFDFGALGYKEIDMLLENDSSKDFQSDLGFPEDKIIVAIGYNSLSNQNHEKIVSAISNLSEDILDKFFFVLHWCYGERDEDYLANVRKIMDSSGMYYTVIEEFWDKEKVAKLRIATDVYLHGPKTDSLSSSLCEYIYADTIVTNPMWLGYKELDDYEIKCYYYSGYNQLKDLLNEIALEGLEAVKDRIGISDNRKKLLAMNSWGVLAPKWQNMYDEVLDEGNEKNGRIRNKNK